MHECPTFPGAELAGFLHAWGLSGITAGSHATMAAAPLRLSSRSLAQKCRCIPASREPLRACSSKASLLRHGRLCRPRFRGCVKARKMAGDLGTKCPAVRRLYSRGHAERSREIWNSRIPQIAKRVPGLAEKSRRPAPRPVSGSAALLECLISVGKDRIPRWLSLERQRSAAGRWLPPLSLANMGGIRRAVIAGNFARLARYAAGGAMNPWLSGAPSVRGWFVIHERLRILTALTSG